MLTNTTLNHSADTKRFTSQLRYTIAALLLILIATAIIWPNASAAGNEAGSHIYPSAANGPGAVTSHVPPPIGAQGMPPAAINPQALSNDATLSALTVSPKDIIGFDAGQDYYEAGFASTVAQATVTATPSNSAATVAITPADAGSADGHQVDLSAGRNTVTITVTSQDGNETEVYTLSLNRGVTATYGWKASEDFDGLLAANINNVGGMWSNGTTMWVVDSGTEKLAAYSATDKTRQASNDVLLHSDNNGPSGLWSNGTTFWVADTQDDKIFAYRVSDGSRDSTKDFDTLDAAGNNAPRGIWSDGTTMWVADRFDDKIYAYQMSDKQRDSDEDFDNLATANDRPTGIWSDGVTMWAANSLNPPKLFAYGLSDKEPKATRDFNTIEVLGSLIITGITSDGVTMWVADTNSPEIGGVTSHRSKVFSFNHPASDNADLNSITVSPRDIIGFEADRTSYEVGVASTVAQATITATKAHIYASVAITPTDVSTGTPGHQVNLAPGKNTVTVTVTAQDESTKTYTVNINQGVTDPFGWKAVDDFDSLRSSIPGDRPRGITQHSGTTWITSVLSQKILAYRADGQRAPSRDITLASANGRADHLWTDGTYIWVLDSQDKRIYVYRLNDGQRQQAKEFTLHGDSFDPTGIWSDGETMWVVEAVLRTTHAYSLDGGTRQQEHEFNLVSDNIASQGVWSDGYTIWLADRGEEKLYAYRLSTGNRDSDKDFNTLSAAGNIDLYGITSDGETMWVVDQDDNKVYSFNHPASDDATLSALTVSPRDIIGFDPDDTHYEVGVASTVAQATITATKAHIYASVAITPTDASLGTPGHQVNLAPGKNTARVIVTAQDESTRTYTVNINRGVTDPFGWKAVDDFDSLRSSRPEGRPRGITQHSGTTWITSVLSQKILAYRADGQRAPSRDITLASANGRAEHLWTDGTYIWVLDSQDKRIYVYRLNDGQRQQAKEFTLHGDSFDPTGIWSDGETMWVVEATLTTTHAYSLDGGTRQQEHEFDLLPYNFASAGVWSDGYTIWLADRTDEKLYAYRLSTGNRDSDKDFNTLSAAGNIDLYGITSDGETMWVVDQDDNKVYSYNMPLASPANLQAQSGNTRVTLTWANPENSDITGYQYRVSADDGSTWNPDWTEVPSSSHTTTSLTVRDLTNGVEHRFEVRALESALRSGPAIIRATPTGPPTVPLPPTLTFLDSLDRQISVEWTHPVEDRRAPTTSYDVRYRRYGSNNRWTNVRRSNTDLSTEQVISGLTNRQGYVIEVAAVNEIGRGPWASGMTAPQGPQSPPSDQTDVAPARFSLGPLGAFWTDGYPATGPHPDRDPLNGNLISTPCAGDTGFTVLWGTHAEAPLGYEAHFITRYGAGTFRHSFVENKTLTGSVKIHGHSILTVRVRARFDEEGWGPWSGPVSLSCTNQEPTEETSQLQVAESQQAEPTNSPATGKPDINGRTEEGDTLTVSTSRIYDANGMNDASFTYQWSRYNGTTTTAIEGAASATYTVHEDDVGNQVSVTVSFADDDGFQESVTSDSVLVSPPSPLYGGFDADTVPQDHNGQDPFTFQIHFSEEPSLGYAAVRDHVLTVTGGTVTGASQTTPGENIRWTITLQPDGDDAVTVELPATASCSDDGAVCTASGKMLSNATSITVAGPVAQQPPPENSPATGQPTIDGTAQVGQTLTADVTGVSDGDGLTNAVYAYQWIANDGNVDTSLKGATSATYAVQVSQVGNSLKVQVSFSDDNGNQESLTSQATAAVSATTPGTPRSLAAKPAGTGELSVSWQPPQSNGGAEVTGYTVQWKLDSGSWDTPADVSQATTTGASHTITGLQLDVEYDVRAMATNSAGDGPAAGQITATPTAQTSQQRENSPAAGRPAITGQARVGETLTADTSGITDADGLDNATFAYQWSANGLGIHGADGSTYTLTGDKEGDRVQVLVSFTDDEGNEESLISAATEPVEPRANRPATGAPTISGTPQVGETLTVHTSGIADADGLDNAEFSYQWGPSGIGIPRATGSTYTISEEDKGFHIQVLVSFTDDAGHEETLTSAATATVEPKPNRPATGQPTISGTIQVGEILTASTSGIADEDGLTNATFAHQWIRTDDSTDTQIAGATGTSYTLVNADKGKTVKVRVSFTDHADNEEALTSAATGTIAPSPLTASLHTDDTPENHDGDNTFTFELRFSEEPELSYTTLRDDAFTIVGVAIVGAKRLDPPSNLHWRITVEPDSDADVSVVLPVTTNCNNDGAICTADSRMLSNRSELTVQGPPSESSAPTNTPATGAPTITGTAQVGQSLQASTSGIADDDGLANATFAHQWVRVDGTNETDIASATESSYALVSADESHTVKVRVSFTDDAGNSESLTSSATATVEPKPNSPATGEPSISGKAQVGETLTTDTSSIADDDGLDNAVFTYQWLRDGSAISSATGSTYTVVEADQGGGISVQVSFTDDDDFAETVTSGTVSIPLPPLTAELTATSGTPDSHDGATAFTILLEFSEDFDIGYETVRDYALDVENGEVIKAKRFDKGSTEPNRRWTMTITPTGNADIIVTIAPTEDCADESAICTADGRMLSSEETLTVAGPP